MAGYSGTPLAKKLGIKAGCRVGLIGAPTGFAAALEPLPEGVAIGAWRRRRYDVVVLFARRLRDLERRLAAAVASLEPAGGLWIAWPKKSSGVATDLTFDPVQKAGLAAGLVDNKVCAVDEIWSGLRFVYRLRDRG